MLELSNKYHCKLDKIVRNFCFEHNLGFSVVFGYYASICIVPVLIHIVEEETFLASLVSEGFEHN